MIDMKSNRVNMARARRMQLQLALAVLMVFLVAAAYAFGRTSASQSAQTVLHDFSNDVHLIERALVENIPLFEDSRGGYKNAQEKINAARQFLNASHMKAVRVRGWQPIEDENEARQKANEGELVSLDEPPPQAAVPGEQAAKDNLYYFYNVPAKFRYLRPEAKTVLDLIAERFQQKLPPVNGVSYRVKLALSSALRPANYQDTLAQKNGNAASESTHRFGGSFDIFYDDFYLWFEPPANFVSSGSSLEALEEIRPKIGFLAGDAFKGQLQTILFETLVEMQNEGMIYIIYEEVQKCYHITVR